MPNIRDLTPYSGAIPSTALAVVSREDTKTAYKTSPGSMLYTDQAWGMYKTDTQTINAGILNPAVNFTNTVTTYGTNGCTITSPVRATVGTNPGVYMVTLNFHLRYESAATPPIGSFMVVVQTTATGVPKHQLALASYTTNTTPGTEIYPITMSFVMHPGITGFELYFYNRSNLNISLVGSSSYPYAVSAWVYRASH